MTQALPKVVTFEEFVGSFGRRRDKKSLFVSSSFHVANNDSETPHCCRKLLKARFRQNDFKAASEISCVKCGVSLTCILLRLGKIQTFFDTLSLIYYTYYYRTTTQFSMISTIIPNIAPYKFTLTCTP